MENGFQELACSRPEAVALSVTNHNKNTKNKERRRHGNTFAAPLRHLFAALRHLCGTFAAPLRHLCGTSAAPLRHLCGTSAALRHLCGNSAAPLRHLWQHLGGTSAAAPRRHLGGTSAAPRRHLGGTSAAPRRHLGSTSAAPRWRPCGAPRGALVVPCPLSPWRPLWHPCGAPEAPLWHPGGASMVPPWCPRNAPEASLWRPCGVHVVSLWRPCGAPAEPMWQRSRGAPEAGLWLPCGAVVARHLWCPYGTLVAPAACRTVCRTPLAPLPHPFVGIASEAGKNACLEMNMVRDLRFQGRCHRATSNA